MPGTITMNGMIILGSAAISGVRRAADIEFGRHGALHHQEVRAPVAERQHEAEPHHQPEDLDAHGVLAVCPMYFQLCVITCRYAAGQRHGRSRAIPLQPPAFITAMMASGAKPITIRKNCSTSL